MADIESTLAERGQRYGDFTDHARICQNIKGVMMFDPASKWGKLSNVQKQALEVIADKVARILSGDPDYADNWHDIQGYAKLVEDRLGPKGWHPDCVATTIDTHCPRCHAWPCQCTAKAPDPYSGRC